MPTPFNQRMGLSQSKPVSNEFPEGARVALAYLIVDLHNKRYLDGDRAFQELLRTARFTQDEFNFEEYIPFIDKFVYPLKKTEWWRIYAYCERVYEHILQAPGYREDGEWIEIASLAEVQKYFTEELNNILAEENIAYKFVNGQFQRRGRAHTQKSIERVGLVLANDSLRNVREHYNKARKFFDERPQPDSENCVKEALCALEACFEILTKKPASNDFSKAVKQIQGNGSGHMPAPIAEGLVKLYAYRGSATGVTHAALTGNRVTELEAEFVLSVVASYITYLVDLLSPPAEEIPF